MQRPNHTKLLVGILLAVGVFAATGVLFVKGNKAKHEFLTSREINCRGKRSVAGRNAGLEACACAMTLLAGRISPLAFTPGARRFFRLPDDLDDIERVALQSCSG